MKLRLLLLIVGLYSFTLWGQSRIKVMSYNLMHYPGTLYLNDATGDYEDRTPVLKEILDSYQPDIFMVCELKNDIGAGQIINEALQTPDNRYDAANFVYNQSSSYDELQQMIFFNKQKLILLNQDIIITTIRDINHYSFLLNTVNKNTHPIYLDVFVAHLKASSSATDQDKRLQMVTEFTDYIENIPDTHYLIFGGDLNLYTDTEAAYQELIDPTNHIVLKDPIDSEGPWHNNSSYAFLHTQSPLQSNGQFQSEGGGSDGVTGGMDDRFDFLLTSENFINGTDLTYVPDTYKAYGNNGNCFNDNLDDVNCSGTYSQTLRNLLVNMSDHIPVVMEIETPETLDTHDFANNISISINGSNMVHNSISLNIPDSLQNTSIEIYNTLGQSVQKLFINNNRISIDVKNLQDGVYYIVNEQISLNSPLKFIKL